MTGFLIASKFRRNAFTLSLLGAAIAFGASIASAEAAPFTAWDRARGVSTEIVLYHDPTTGRGFDWTAISAPRLPGNSPLHRLRDGVRFLQEGIARMTGHEPPIRSATDVARGIVLLAADDLPPDLRDDPAIRTALADDGTDSYNHREAFYLRSGPARLLIVANTLDGLIAAMPALLDSVGYEVLGMGPNWIHVPREHRDRLTFNLERTERPSFYLRSLTATTGQSYGVGTLNVGPKLKLSDSQDESVSVSYARWTVGARIACRSMAQFPGHAMYQHHRPLREEMLRSGSTTGFLTPENHLGLDADRPPAAATNRHHLWINTDAAKTPGHGRSFVSDGETWKEQNPIGMGVNLDPTAPIARAVVLAELKQRAEAYFAALEASAGREEPLIFGTEAEDGAGYAHIGEWVRPENRNWYPDYLQAEGVAWPQPYVLHGYRGIDQPQERFDIATPADTVFAFNNWLLREYDKWIDSLPAAERVTKSGTSKKELVRCSLYSYAFHDVPPHLNLDPRIRVMIAGYPKHRGLREWKLFAKPTDVAAAFKQMLPREPSGEYRIISIAYYADFALEGIPTRWSAAPARIIEDYKRQYDAGIRALAFETDFNFGKFGLGYYLLSKYLWNARLTADELEAVRNRWLERAYGSAAPEMRAYYDFMLPENLTVNAPNAWAKAIRLIDAADAKLDPAKEPDAQRRLDDLKQYWYYYYLVDVGAMKEKSPEMVEFLWKGQMSYITAMHMALSRTFGAGSRKVSDFVGELQNGPAHYTADETAVWWRKILAHWPTIEVATFADAALADGRRGRDVDLNDLVQIADFQSIAAGKPFHFNSAQAPPTSFVTTARQGEKIGFRFGWPSRAELRFYGPKDVPYGAEYWDSDARQWIPVVDVTTTIAASHVIRNEQDGNERHVVEVEVVAPHDGTYRFEVGRGGFAVLLASLGYRFENGAYQARPGFSFPERPSGLTQDPVYVYVPKGTKTVDLEVWDSFNKKQLQLYRGLGEKGPIKSRTVDISRRGTHRIALEPGEDGNLAQISGNGFAVPLLYSIPGYWAKCPAELLVPRAVAQADGLKLVD